MKMRVLLPIVAAVLLGNLPSGVGHAAPAAQSTVITESLPMRSLLGSRVTGTTVFSYNYTTNQTTVTMDLQHLVPGSIHPSHIHRGRCGSNGPVVYAFPIIQADRRGNAHVSLTEQIQGNFVQQTWYINVHMGPQMVGRGLSVIACGNVL